MRGFLSRAKSRHVSLFDINDGNPCLKGISINIIFLIFHVLFLRLLILLFVVATLTGSISAQNLVPNGDFETFTECPDNLDQFSNASGWIPYRGTPDYFNACNVTNYVGTPLNLTNGFQFPLSGNGYGGFIGLEYNNNREIMGTELISPLVVGQEYYVEFYWSRTFGGLAHSNCDCASSHLGALFSTHSYDNINDIIPVTNSAHVYDPTLLVDSTNWVKISGWFTADSAYTHLAIGDFFDLENNEVAYYNGTSETLFLNTYYYIEDVCVATDPAMCGVVSTSESIDKNKGTSLFPNPALTVLNIDTDFSIVSISITSLDGKQLLSYHSTSTQIDISGLAPGIYIIILKTKRGSIRRKFIKNNSL